MITFSLIRSQFFKCCLRCSSTGKVQFSTQGMVQVPIQVAQETTVKALEKLGWNKSDANIQAQVMIHAELCGNNQGLVKMLTPEIMTPAPGAGKPEIERETSTSAVINGNQAPGILSCVRAADLAASKVESKDSPISIVSIYNTSTSSGQLAFYVERMARKGIIGIALANSPEYVAAAPGGKPVFGTNPLAIGIPQKDSPPFTFDMATSAIALFGVVTAKAKGEALPPYVAYGKDGKWSTNAAEVLDEGAIATFGGHKGAGLSLCVEILAGALSGSAVLGQVESKKNAKSSGHTFVAINPDALVDDFDSKVKSIIDAVRSSGNSIRIPGERSSKTAEERRVLGEIPVPLKVWENITNAASNGI